MRVQPPKDYKKYRKTIKNYKDFEKYLRSHRVIFYDRDEMNIVDFWKEFKEGKNTLDAIDKFITLFPYEYQIHVMMIFGNIV